MMGTPENEAKLAHTITIFTGLPKCSCFYDEKEDLLLIKLQTMPAKLFSRVVLVWCVYC